MRMNSIQAIIDAYELIRYNESILRWLADLIGCEEEEHDILMHSMKNVMLCNWNHYQNTNGWISGSI
jgi:hypothetical protein